MGLVPLSTLTATRFVSTTDYSVETNQTILYNRFQQGILLRDLYAHLNITLKSAESVTGRLLTQLTHHNLLQIHSTDESPRYLSTEVTPPGPAPGARARPRPQPRPAPHIGKVKPKMLSPGLETRSHGPVLSPAPAEPGPRPRPPSWLFVPKSVTDQSPDMEAENVRAV